MATTVGAPWGPREGTPAEMPERTRLRFGGLGLNCVLFFQDFQACIL